jgi:hypothetical protein
MSAVYVFWGDDARDRVRERRSGLMRDIGVDENTRGLHLRKVEHKCLVSEDDATMADPPGRIEQAQTTADHLSPQICPRRIPVFSSSRKSATNRSC